MNHLEMTCSEISEYYIDRIHHLCECGRMEDAFALNQELREWIDNFGSPQEIVHMNYIGD